MKTSPALPIERFWSLLAEDGGKGLAALLAPDAGWDDPLHDRASGDAVAETAIPRLSAWYAERSTGAPVQPLRTTRDERRVVVESVLGLRDGLVWNQAAQRSERAKTFELATAIVADRAARGDGYTGIRVYFGTWSVLDGASRVRKGPICPDERAKTKEAIDGVPLVRAYFDALATGDPKICDMFEPDGYFREPANNFACGREQLAQHFEHILKLGGVGVEFLTATREEARLGVELQTVVWGTKKMPVPQAGFAIYELGPNGKLSGARVYDSVVPPEL
jgi:hypothetical protein